MMVVLVVLAMMTIIIVLIFISSCSYLSRRKNSPTAAAGPADGPLLKKSRHCRHVGVSELSPPNLAIAGHRRLSAEQPAEESIVRNPITAYAWRGAPRVHVAPHGDAARRNAWPLGDPADSRKHRPRIQPATDVAVLTDNGSRKRFIEGGGFEDEV